MELSIKVLRVYVISNRMCSFLKPPRCVSSGSEEAHLPKRRPTAWDTPTLVFIVYCAVSSTDSQSGGGPTGFDPGKRSIHARSGLTKLAILSESA